MKRAYDLVIVGSGAGGGQVADRLIPLAEAGARIAVLEAGPHFPNDYFTQRELEMLDLFWNAGGWPTEDGSVTLAAGRGVGGSTLMYTGVTFRLPDAVVREWGIEGITPADLAPRFDRLERDLRVMTPGPEMDNDNNRLFKAGCERLGWPVERLRLNIAGCEGAGFCNLGCTEKAKQGTLEVQLPRAMAAGIEVIPNCRVDRVEDRTVFVAVDKAPPGTLPGPWPPGEAEIRADTVVLAAGSPGSPAILLRSGFGRDLPALGRYFTLHPAMTVYGVYPEPIVNHRGFPKTFYTPKFSGSHGYYLETAFYYPFITTKHMGLWGEDLVWTMNRYRRLMAILILNHDPALPENRITVDRRGRTRLRYRIGRSSAVALCHAQAQAARIFFAAGCGAAVMPCARRPLFRAGEVPDRDLESFISPEHFLPGTTPVSSAHPQGGCRMGADPADSVTDPWGRVHGAPWLRVADASLFPKSARVNPYLTVMALADRVAEGILGEHPDGR